MFSSHLRRGLHITKHDIAIIIFASYFNLSSSHKLSTYRTVSSYLRFLIYYDTFTHHSTCYGNF